MKKMFFTAAVAALALSSCSSDDLVQAPEVNGAEDGAVLFSAYQGRSNRAIVNEETAKLANGGFGVFAYEQGISDWKNYVTSYNVPNFMYNQKVLGYDGSGVLIAADANIATATIAEWKYEPVKYFSNVPDAKHSFFAYAPWKSDINVKFSTTGPKIHYNMAENYDLLWGHKTVAGNPVTYIDLKKQDVNYKLDFTFEHMLTQIKVDLAYFSDIIHDAGHTNTTSEDLAEGTKIIIRSVKLVGPIATEGELDLATGNWVYTNVDEKAFEKSDIVFVGGVDDKDEVKVAFDNFKILPPMNGQSVKIKVVYDVETIDKKDDTGLNNHVVTNTWESDDLTLLKGHSYTYHLHIGMTSVKFQAEVSDNWKAEDEENIDLPVTNLMLGLAAVKYTTVATEAEKPTSADPVAPAVDDICYVVETDKFYKCEVAGTWPAEELETTKLYFNPEDGKLYQDAGFTTLASLAADTYYLVDGELYVKKP